MHKKEWKYVFLKEPKIRDNFLYISVEQLKMLILHEKDNCVFLLGEKLILRQKKGIAIGGHMSSALAIMLANYAEHMSLSAMVNYSVMGLKCNEIIGGLRITDDGLIFVAVNRKWRQATKLCAMVLDLFVGLFMTFSNGSLNLIFEDYCRVYEFLENLVSIIMTKLW